MPVYFSRQSKFSSFTRLFYDYGFRRTNRPSDGFVFRHENFRRDDESLCLLLRRGPEKRRTKRQPRTPPRKTNPKSPPKSSVSSSEKNSQVGVRANHDDAPHKSEVTVATISSGLGSCSGSGSAAFDQGKSAPALNTSSHGVHKASPPTLMVPNPLGDAFAGSGGHAGGSRVVPQDAAASATPNALVGWTPEYGRSTHAAAESEEEDLDL